MPGSTNIVPKKRGRNINKLTDQQRAFCHHVLENKDFNYSKAAKQAGYSNPPQAAAKLLKNETVSAYLGKCLQERLDSSDVNAARVLRELSYIALLNPKELFESDGSFKQIHDLPDHVARAISGWDVTVVERTNHETGELERETKVKVKTNDKLKALELLAKHVGLLEQNLNINLGLDESENFLADLLRRVEDDRRGIVDSRVIDGIVESESD